MLKKLVKLLLCQKNQENFQANNIVAKSDRGKNFIGHIRLKFDFRPCVLLEKKLFLTIYGFPVGATCSYLYKGGGELLQG